MTEFMDGFGWFFVGLSCGLGLSLWIVLTGKVQRT